MTTPTANTSARTVRVGVYMGRNDAATLRAGELLAERGATVLERRAVVFHGPSMRETFDLVLVEADRPWTQHVCETYPDAVVVRPPITDIASLRALLRDADEFDDDAPASDTITGDGSGRALPPIADQGEGAEDLPLSETPSDTPPEGTPAEGATATDAPPTGAGDDVPPPTPEPDAPPARRARRSTTTE